MPDLAQLVGQVIGIALGAGEDHGLVHIAVGQQLLEQGVLVVQAVGPMQALLDHILTESSLEQAIVFTSTQRDADWLADRLAELGHAVASLHGGMPQGRRNRVLQGLRSKHLRVLVATDVAARGIDVPTSPMSSTSACR